jgi:hypothetical protein
LLRGGHRRHAARDRSSRSGANHARLRRVAPPRVSSARRPVSSRPTRGFRGRARPAGLPPRVSRDAGGSSPSLPGDRERLRGDVHTVPGAPGAATKPKLGVFPTTDSRRPRRAGAGPVGLQARWPSPGPSWPWGSPWPSRSPHRVEPETFAGVRYLALVCFSCPTNPARAVLVVVVVVPTRPADHSVGPAMASSPRGCPRSRPSGWPYDRLVRVSKDRPSTVSRAEESTSRGHVAVTASETGRQPASCAASVVLHHPGGLLLPDPARVLHRASSPGVRDVSSPRQRIPTTRSCPSKLCSLRAAGRHRITPGQPGHVTLSDPPRGTPWSLPPRPWVTPPSPSANSR